MDIQNIFEQELKPLEEDQDINEFIIELFSGILYLNVN